MFNIIVKLHYIDNIATINNKEVFGLFIGILAVIIAAVYAFINRSERRQVIYAGLGLLAVSVVLYIIMHISFSQFGPSMYIVFSDMAYYSLMSLLWTVPSAVIILCIGLFMRSKKKN